ncbi:sulfatase [Paenibacillus sp. 1P07SE]|uniref:sulfatase family protein n=1 Tax=Paenibacillus sp. 1P07SE TaxID=3132209 RepID=UPI0039A780DE
MDNISQAKADRRPNILFIFADQLRGMDMGCAGNPDVITPHMDRLAGEGVRYAKAYANLPVCGPSRATLLTGTYPMRHHVIGNDLPLPETMPTVGEAFQAAGYRTGYIGKWHLDGLPRDKWTPPGPRRHGFDYWAGYNCSHHYYREDKYYLDGPEPVRREGYEPEIQTDLALSFLEQQGSEPFCLFVSWGPPHDPYHMVPERYKEMYQDRPVKLRPNVKPIAPGETSLARDMDPLETLKLYYAAITALDDQLGRLLAALEERGLAEDTIVVFTSDHGDMLWSQGYMKKQQPWEESIHIPLLIRWPARQQENGTVCDSLVSIVDMAPTLLGLAGVQPLPAMTLEGSDFSATLVGGEYEEADSVFILDMIQVDESRRQQLPEWRGLRTGRYTYACRSDGTEWLLYDNQNDPYQLHNLIGDSAHASLRRSLAQRLERWLTSTGDGFDAGKSIIRRLGLTEAWNARERAFHPGRPDLIEEETTEKGRDS